MFPAEEFEDVPDETLAEWINTGHMAIKMAVKRLAVHAMQVGAWLTEMKRRQVHGEWLIWLADNCPEITRRTATNYMKLYDKAVNANGKLVSHLSVTQAYRELGIVKDPTDKLEVEPPPLPEGKYNVIYADPPWRYDFSPTDSRKIENQKSRRNWNLYRRARSVLKLEDEIRERAKEQQGMRTDLSPNSGKGYKPIDTERELASLAEVGHDTMNKVMFIEQYATGEERNLLVEGKASINEIHRKIKRRMSKVEVEPPPLPEGEYNVIYADLCCGGDVLPKMLFTSRRRVLLCMWLTESDWGRRFVVKKWLTIWIMFCIILGGDKNEATNGKRPSKIKYNVTKRTLGMVTNPSQEGKYKRKFLFG